MFTAASFYCYEWFKILYWKSFRSLYHRGASRLQGVAALLVTELQLPLLLETKSVYCNESLENKLVSFQGRGVRACGEQILSTDFALVILWEDELSFFSYFSSKVLQIQ